MASTATPKPLAGRIALITGASRGLGRATAVAMARAGAHVIATSRTSGALEELDDDIQAAGGTATLLPLDLRKVDRIDQLGPTIFQRWGKLDIFVANAGQLGPLSPLGHVTAEAWAMVMDVNLNANWRLIRALDPLLRNSSAGRAIFITSGAADGHHAYWGPYAVSKAGLEALARTYALETAETAVRVSLINPGPMRTAMRAKAFPGEKPESLPAPEQVAPLLVERAGPREMGNGERVDYKEWAEAAQSRVAE